MGTVRWDVDSRKPTLLSRLYVLAMRARRDERAFTGESRTRRIALRRQRRGGDREPTPWTRIRRRVRTVPGPSGMTVWSVRPRQTPIAVRVLYLHGGGYIHPLTVDYWRLVRALSGIPAEVVVPAYPLAPASTVDDVVPALLELLRSVASDEHPTFVMGDSAGGALAIVLAQQMRDRGEKRLTGVICLCPWLDGKLDEREVATLESTDPMLEESGLRAAARWWAGARSVGDPQITPLNGSLDDLPPLDVVVGDRDILRPAVDQLAERARRDDCELHVHEVTAMFHVWMTRAIPEGRSMRRRLVRMVRDRAEEVRAGRSRSILPP